MMNEDEARLVAALTHAASDPAFIADFVQRTVGPFKQAVTASVDAEIARLDAAADAAVSRIEAMLVILDRILRDAGLKKAP